MKDILQNIKARLCKAQATESAAPAPEETEAPCRKKKSITPMQVFSKVLMVIFIATFCFSAFQIIRNARQADQRDELYTDLSNVAVKPAAPKPAKPNPDNGDSTDTTQGTEEEFIVLAPGLHVQSSSPISVDFDYLTEKNPDVMAWVYCPGTPINYPVVRGADNDYYLNRLLDGTVNKSGSIFADCRNRVDFTDPHTIIYGHNMKDLSMFGSVNKYADQEYYDQHPVWYINTPERNFAVVLLAGYTTSPNAEIYAFKGTSEEPWEIYQNALRQSAFQSKAAALPGESLVTFSTCHGNSRRFVLLGVLREIG